MHTPERYRRFSWITDVRGIKNAIGEMRGWGHPAQPLFSSGAPDNRPTFTAQWFVDALRESVAFHAANAMEGPLQGERIFDEPLVGFVRGDDPLLKDFKRLIAPQHFTPQEILAWQAHNAGVPAPSARDTSVVCFILPLSAATIRANASRHDWASERWAQTRLLGEIFSQVLVREIVTFLMQRGILAVSPDVTPVFRKQRYPGVGWASPWSHRHMAYAAGLGSFGRHAFLITEKGVAHRCGSFVVNLRLDPTHNRPDDPYAHCLHHQGIPCLACAQRCPVGAITPEGHDKEACARRVARSLIHCNRNYHIFIYGCGLCATGVPCAQAIPRPLAP